MQVITDLSRPAWTDGTGGRSVLTIGAYDGVHLGHQAVIREVRRQAAELGARSVVVTFDRHPASVVRPESAPKLLTDLDQKLELLAATGVDATVLVHFDDAQAAESPQSFVERVLVGCLAAQRIVVGEDFHFGQGRSGNVALLREVGVRHDFDVEPLDLIERTDGIAEPLDVILSAGNVMTFLAPATRRDVLARLRAHLAAEGRLVIGFGGGRGYEFDEFFADAAAVGLTEQLRLSTWDLRPFDAASTFLVAVLAAD